MVPLSNVHSQDHWVTLPDGKRISLLHTENPQEVVKAVVTLKNKLFGLCSMILADDPKNSFIYSVPCVIKNYL